MGAWRPGMKRGQAVSGNGKYREQAGEDVLTLSTCAWRGFEFITIGSQSKPIFSPELPDSYRTQHLNRDWTGRTIDYRWGEGDGQGLSIDLRTTLPGPLLRTHGRCLRLRWASGAEPPTIEGLAGATSFNAHGLPEAGGHRLWLAASPLMPVMIAASAPVRAIRVTSHLHWEIEFMEAGGALLVVPLLAATDAPRDPIRQAQWLALAEHPPLDCSERYQVNATSLVIEASFGGARLAPVPPALMLLGSTGSLVEPPLAQVLLKTWCGPYAVVAGDRWQASISMGWSAARWAPTRPVTGPLAEPPVELAYAGDATWEPGTAMDQLWALRTWAPLLSSAPADLRQRLVAQLTPPTAAELKAAIEPMVEPTSGLTWGRFISAWQHVGDASYDLEAYNGLALSGLARAVECGIPAIVDRAKGTASACKHERSALADYMQVFHDWALCSAWTDARGWMWNADCAHNGMEGLLAEARLCDAEGDAAGADRMRYLAGRTAVGLSATLELPTWIAALTRTQPTPSAFSLTITGMITWSSKGETGEAVLRDAVGTQCLTSWRDISICTARTRNPYILAGHFPEWNALLATHVDRSRLAGLAKAWEGQPERYADWERYYLGDDWLERAKRGDQEARCQSAVFYNLAPEIALRRFVLGEDATTLEARFATPLNLAEQLLLRAAFTVSAPAKDGASTSRPAGTGPKSAVATTG